jgi:hypothetical protein
MAQAPAKTAPSSPATAQSTAPTNSYVVSGTLSDADLDRLLVAIRKLNTVEQAELKKVAGAVVLYVRGTAQGTILLTAVRSAGFEIRQMPVRLYVGHGPSPDTDSAPLRALLENLPGVEQIAIEKKAAGIALRVRGVVQGATLAAAAKPSGFTLQMVSAYVASGSSAETDLARLRAVLKNLAGFERLELKVVSGGATLLVYGDVQEKELTTATHGAGYALLPVSDPAENTQRFRVQGVTDAGGEEKLRSVLSGLGGMGAIQIRSTPEGTRLGITNGATSTPLIVAGAKAAGFALVPMESVSLPTLEDDSEKITPPAPNERTLEEFAKFGELAPDFTLITQHGKGKISLADYRDKRPVVLIFGSYT